MHGVPVRRRHLIACLDGSDIEKANTLENDLNGVVIPWSGNEHLLSPRHRVIAGHVIYGPVTVAVREVALKRYLAQISGDINPTTVKMRTAEFIAYRSLINFDSMQDLFGDDYNVIDGIYDELKAFYGEDYLFWLQYGRAQVHFDNFSVAENHLNQSLGIRYNYQAEHHMGVMFLKRALFRESAAEAAADVKRGEEILRHQIRDRGDTDAYPYSALLTHKFRYLRKYGSSRLHEELTDLKELAETAMRKHSLDESLKDTYKDVLHAYVSLAVLSDDQAEPVEAEELDDAS